VLQAQVITFWLTIALYAGATVLYAYHFLSKVRSYSFYATLLTGAGFLCNTASIGLRSAITHGTVLTGANTLVLAAWAIVLVYFVVEHLIHLKVYGTVLVPLALLLLLVAQLLGAGRAAAVLSPMEAALLESWLVGVHVALIVFANAGLAIGAAASITYLVLEAQLKGHHTSTLFRRLPSLAQTDLVARRSISWAFPAYTAGLVLGILRAIETDIAGWWADPRVMLSGLVWIIFAVYLYLHYGRGVSGKTTAYVAILGLVFVIALSLTARLVPIGFHVFGVAGR
jgi:ABC-type uncharacterized transport system permease subunit